MKKLLAISLLSVLPSLSMAQVDPNLNKIPAYIEQGLKCQKELDETPAIVIFNILENTKSMVKVNYANRTTVYLATPDQQGRGAISVMGLAATRTLLVVKSGSNKIIPGLLFSGRDKLSPANVLGSYRGMLKKDFQMRPLPSLPLFTKMSVREGEITTEPLMNGMYLLTGVIDTGERFVACATKENIDFFGR